MAANARGEAVAMFGCVIPGAAALAVGVGVYSFVSDHMDETIFALGIVGIVAVVALVVLVALAFVRWFDNRQHDLALRREQQRQAEALSNRLHLDNQIMAQRAHLVELTADRQFVPMDRLDARAAYVLIGQRIDSLRQTMPQTLHLTTHDKRPALTVEDVPVAERANDFQPPTLWDLYSNGQLSPDRLVLGFNHADNGMLWASQEVLFSTLVGGLAKQGKSTFLRSLGVQMALQGSKFLILDKHFGSGAESLAQSLLPFERQLMAGIATNDKEMADVLKLIWSVVTNRLSGADKDRTPITLLVDETTGLLLRSDLAGQLTETLAYVAQESRKVGVFAIAAGHQWNNRILPTDVRDSFANKISMRAYKKVAFVMSNSLEFAEVAEGLPRFNGVWMDDGGEINSFSIPLCTAQHVDNIAASYYARNARKPAQLVVEPHERPHERPHDAPHEIDSEAADGSCGEVLKTSAAQRAIHLFYVEEKSPADVIKEVWGVKSNAGAPYIKAGQELAAIQRAYVRSLRKG